MPASNWPARLQRLTAGSLVAHAPAEAEIWLDGGHNPGAGIVVAEAMADLEERVARPLFLVSGMLNTKDPVGFYRPFAGLAKKVFTVPVPGSAAGRDPDELATAARAAGLIAEPAADVDRRLRPHRRRALARPAAAHPHLRLALSRRHDPRAERHAAGLTPSGDLPPALRPAICP